MAKTKPTPSPKSIPPANNVSGKGTRGTFGRTITIPPSGKSSPKK